MKTRRARSPCFQSIKRVIGFSLKLSDCYAKFGAARLSLFQLSYSGWVFLFRFHYDFYFKFIFYFTIFCCLGASPPGKATALGGDALRGGLRDVFPGQGRPAPGLRNRAAPTPRAQLGLPAGIALGGHSGEQQRKYINRITHHARRERIRNRPGKGT